MQTTEPKTLSPIQTCLLQIATAIQRLQAMLPMNHRLQDRLAAIAKEITGIAREVEQK